MPPKKNVQAKPAAEPAPAKAAAKPKAATKPKVAKEPAAKEPKVAKEPAAKAAKEPKVAKEPKAEKPPVEPAVSLDTPIEGLENHYISHARVKTLMVEGHLNAAVNNAAAALKKTIDEHKYAKKVLASGKIPSGTPYETTETVDGVQTTTKHRSTEDRDLTAAEKKAFTAIAKKNIDSVEREYEAYHALSLRMGGHTHDAVAAVCDAVVTEIVRKALVHASALRKKNISIAHIYESDITTLSLYPLIENLPTVKAGVSAEQERRRQAATEAVIQSALKAAKVPKAAKVAAEEAEAEAEEVADEAEDADAKYPFGYHIQRLTKDISKIQHPGVGTRPSRVTFEHLSDVVSELIARLCNQILISVSDSKSKTIGTKMVMSAVKRILTDGHAPHETVTLQTIKVADPAAIEAEKAKKAAAKAKGESYEIDYDSLPQIEEQEAEYTVTYPTSAYEALAARVDAYLAAASKGKAE